MVESNYQLDLLFTALSDSTRRNILSRVAEIEMSIGEIAEHYKLTFAAISKHIQVLEKAGLVIKKRRGKQQVVIIVPAKINLAREHIERYANLWASRFDKLENILKQE
ncbi:winged helix-turn-helix transcriptional regulator [Candidatus Saccharibacteria bacterium]|nr:winged helix-turn-helix transcriptional regulator [Candidatus Saccharibacteria bacterium]